MDFFSFILSHLLIADNFNLEFKCNFHQRQQHMVVLVLCDTESVTRYCAGDRAGGWGGGGLGYFLYFVSVSSLENNHLNF